MTDRENAPEPTAEKPRVTPDQVRAAFSIAAPFANKIVITASGGSSHVRLSFLETHADEQFGLEISEARTAVTMSINEMIALRDLLTRFAEDNLRAITVRIGADGKTEIVEEAEGDGD